MENEMAEKITELTPSQTALMPEYVKKWTDIGLSTGPVDKENAVAAIKKAYRVAGLDEPTQFYYTKSPLDAIKCIQKLDPSKSKSDIYGEMIYGNQDASWLSFYDYMFEEVIHEKDHIAKGLMDIAECSGWLNVYEDVVVFQDRPVFIKMDENNLLHSETGPAIEYSDGMSVYSWHGTRIPGEWIDTPEKLKPADALAWANVEQRRCACEIIGWDTILESLNCEVIDEDGDPSIGTLVEVDSVSGDGRDRFLRVVCGTGRKFALPVPPEMTTALEAQCWGYDVPVDIIEGIEVRT